MFPVLFKGLDVKKFQCSVCEFAKHKRVIYPSSNKRTYVPLSLIHSDVWGPTTVPNISKARWFIVFVNDCTRVMWLVFMKNEVNTIFPNFYNMISTQFGVKIKRLRFDNAKDFFNQSLSNFFQQKRIIHESSCPYTPQQNGVDERKNGHLLAITRALFFHHNVPKHYWGETVLIATSLINRLPSQTLDSLNPMQLINKHNLQLNKKIYSLLKKETH